MQKKWLTFILAMSLISCEKSLKIDTEDYDRKIVVNSLFHPAENMSAVVTRSMDLAQTDIVEELENAVVEVYENGVYKENMTFTDGEASGEKLGKFYADFAPEEGKGYELKITVGEEQVNTNIAFVPPQTPINSFSSNWVKWGDSTNIIRYYFDFTIDDPLIPSYYYFDLSFPIYKFNEEADSFELYQTKYMEISSNDLPNYEPYFNNGILFNDEGFDGTQKRITGTATTFTRFEPPEDLSEETFVYDKSKLFLSLHSVTNEGYKFHSSVAKKIAANADIYSEPVVIYSNINDGLGIFASENITRVEVEVVY